MSQRPLEDRDGVPAVPGPGSQVAGYLLEQQIGAGGMAVVYRARDVRLGRLVALKVMAPAMAGDEEFRLRFVREARAAAAVDDPHIIPVYEAGNAGGMLFIAMRFVGGGDLRSLLRREGPLPPHQVMSVISPVASALDAAHAAGLVHRDVKPANMLLDTRQGRPDHVYLSDFGLSKGMQSGHLTGSGHFLGTPDYTAPEQIAGTAVDGRADQYALACSAFELLAGTVPFARGEGWATVWAHLNTPPPTLSAVRPGLSPAADAVLARAMAKSPRDRYPSCREFAEALRAALDTGSSSLAAPGVAAAVTGGSRRRRRRTITLTAAVLICAAAAAALTVPGLIRTGTLAASTGPSADVPLFGQIEAFTPPRVPGHWQEATSVAFSPDGRTLAVGLTIGRANDFNARTFGGGTYLFNVATGRQSADLGVGGSTAAFSPSGNLLAASGGSGQHLVYLASAGAGAAMSKTATVLPGTGDLPVEGMAFSPDGRLLAARDYAGDFYLWSTATKRPIPTGISQSSGYTALAFSPDGKTIATAGLGEIYLWNAASGRLTGLITPSQNAIALSLAYSPDGRLIAVPLDNGGVGLWNAATRKRAGVLQEPGTPYATDVAFSPNGQLLAVGDANGKTYLWDVRTGKLIAALANPLGPTPLTLEGQTIIAVSSVAFSPDGRTLATSDADGNAYLWRVR